MNRAKATIVEILKENGGQMSPTALRDEAQKRGMVKRDYEYAIQSLLAWDEVGLGPLLTIALPGTPGVTYNFY